MNPFEAQLRHDYDLVASNIQCRADRDGAQIFEVEAQSGFYRGGTFRVLAHTETDAQMAADDDDRE